MISGVGTGSGGEQLGVAQGLDTDVPAQPDRYRMAKDFPNDTVLQMPQVACSGMFDSVTFGQLTLHGFNQPTQLAEQPRQSRVRIVFFGVERGMEADTKLRKQSPEFGVPVGTVADTHAVRRQVQFGQHRLVGGVGRSQLVGQDDAGTARDAQVQPEAVKDVAIGVRIAVGGLAGITPAEPSPAKAAGEDRHAIGQPGDVVGHQLSSQTLLQQVLDFPQVGGLSDEGGAVDRNQGWEGVGMVAPEEPKQLG